MDYSKFQTIAAIPEASSMIETFRAIGYNLETAIADIIDNSVSANAKNIWINFEWLGADTWLSIIDDGDGMDNSEIINAMRPGSINPLLERKTKDLGRFGMGLKTASFSQARKLTILSKTKTSKLNYWTWDLDFVKETGNWNLIKYSPDEKFENKFSKLKSGTIVVWNDIDRVVKDFKKEDNSSLDKFLFKMELVKKHLAMVFHKFIENRKIKIYLQDDQIDAWNPFLISEKSTQIFPEERILNGKVKITGFVLPHKTKITEKKYKLAEGIKGWNEQQGFYIYRNDRLLVSGDWLGLFRKEDHYKLTRIQIEIPNSLDSEWQIPITKSIAHLPILCREHIKSYALNVRSRAVEVFRHRGSSIRSINQQNFVPLWIDYKRENKWFYKINRDHPLLNKIKDLAKTDSNDAINILLKFIEETIPVKSIYIKESEVPELQGKPFEDTNHDVIIQTMKMMYNSLISNGRSREQAKAIIINIEPFNSFPQILDSID